MDKCMRETVHIPEVWVGSGSSRGSLLPRPGLGSRDGGHLRGTLQMPIDCNISMGGRPLQNALRRTRPMCLSIVCMRLLASGTRSLEWTSFSTASTTPSFTRRPMAVLDGR